MFVVMESKINVVGILLQLIRFITATTTEPLNETGPILCSSCECHHQYPAIIKISCTGNQFRNIVWDDIIPIEAELYLKNEKVTFDSIPMDNKILITSINMDSSEVEDLDISGFKSLQKVTLSRVNITGNVVHFSSVPGGLRKLAITKSRLQEVKLTYNHSIHQNLSLIDLSGNKLTRIPFDYYVEIYYLRHNALRSINTDDASCMPMRRLKHLDLSYNHIHSLPDTAFQCILQGHRLEFSINLAHNSIQFIHDRAFAYIQVKEIDLSHNHLKRVRMDAMDWWQVKRLNLQHNPWHCNCNAQWMLDTLLPHINNTNPALLEHLTCLSPKIVKGLTFLMVYEVSSELGFCGPSSIFGIEVEVEDMMYWLIAACLLILVELAVIIFLCMRYNGTNTKATGSHLNNPQASSSAKTDN